MKKYQKRNRAGLAKERWIIAGTSVFVLTALTLTGVYVRDLNKQNSDGYVVDFGAMEDSIAEKNEAIRDAVMDNSLGTPGYPEVAENISDQTVPSDDLDFDPYFQEANSNQVENYEAGSTLSDAMRERIGNDNINNDPPELLADITSVGPAVGEAVLTDKPEVGEAVMAEEAEIEEKPPVKTNTAEETVTEINEAAAQKTAAAANNNAGTATAGEDIPAISTSMQSALTFSDNDNLVWPIVGNVLINYSMDKMVYFATLDHYKYNPAIIIQADEGEIITAASSGKVISVFEDPQIGKGITVELGSGYELTYGQLNNILVSEGSFVAAGDVVAEVAAPTKYYSVEGTNVYFKLTKDGEPVNPMTKLR